MRKYLLLLAVIVGTSALKAQKRILPDEASKHLGEKVIVTGKIQEGKLVQKTRQQTTILNMGLSSRNAALYIIINDEDRKNFPYKPEEYFTRKRVAVTGVVLEVNGSAAIAINGPEDIKVEQPTGGQEFKPLEFDGFNRFFQD